MAKGGKPENLRPFKKGEDDRRNMKGRPPKLPALDEMLAEVLGDDNNPQKLSAAKAILMALRSKAVKGDIRAAEILLDRAYGKVRQPVDLDGEVEVIKVRVPGED